MKEDINCPNATVGDYNVGKTIAIDIAYIHAERAIPGGQAEWRTKRKI
jgi:hypothetical protein